MAEIKDKISTGKTKYAWITYTNYLTQGEQSIQVIEWPNGEGFTIIRNDETTTDFDWQEFDAVKKAIKAIEKHENKL